MSTDADLYAAELALVRQQLDDAKAALARVDDLLAQVRNDTDGIQQ